MFCRLLEGRECNGCAKRFFLIFISFLPAQGHFYQRQQLVSEDTQSVASLKTVIPLKYQGNSPEIGVTGNYFRTELSNGLTAHRIAPKNPIKRLMYKAFINNRQNINRV